MSAITNNHEKTLIEKWGIAKYHSRIKVIVHSHASNDPLDISNDVAQLSTSKNIKGAGQLNVAIVPTRGYLNSIFPNDYINVYADVGDGRGWTRLFFGLVDRMEESYSVDSSGTPNTIYSIVCTDFTKIVTKTEIYFNPQISLRRDLNGLPFGTLNVGGLALMSSGIAVFGSPDTIVTTNLILTLGFGTQFSMPASYPVPTAIIKEARENRKRAALRLIQNRISPTDYNVQKATISANATVEAQQLVQASSTEHIITALVQKYRVNPNSIEIQNAAASRDADSIAAIISDQELRKVLGIDQSIGSVGDTAIAVDRTANANQKPSIMDYIDIYSFVEREAMDGYTASVSIYQQQGPIQSFLTSYSNEMVNEMFFDLRPRHRLDSDDVFRYTPNSFTEVPTDDWVREPDDIAGNKADPDHANCQDGIQYVPALIMREYPFSTIGSLDASTIPISISNRVPATNTGRGPNQETTANNQSTVGEIFLGAVFSHRPNTAGRHYVSTPNINVEDIATGSAAKYGRKIIDVAVISEKEIKSSKLGRSDEDHVNLTEVWADGPIGQDAKWYMQDLSPVVTPIHIMRHGLRRRTLSTIFCRYNRSAVQRTAPALPPEDDTPVSEESPNVVQQGDKTLATIPAGSVVWPTLGSKSISSPYGYRLRRNKQNFVFDNQGNWVASSSNPPPANFYKFHHGIDIPDGIGTPVVAAMDGEVVIVGLRGMHTGYGNIVVIKHTTPHVGYTAYAHLNTIAANLISPVLAQLNGVPETNPARKAARSRGIGMARSEQSNGKMTPIRVRAGEIIGTMGGTSDIGESFPIHLHFEFDVAFPPNYPVAGKDPNNPGPLPLFSGTLTNTDPRLLAKERLPTLRSKDPEIFLNIRNAPIATDVANNAPATVTDEQADDDDGTIDDITNLPNSQLNNPTAAASPTGAANTNPNVVNGQIPSSNTETSPTRSGIVPVMDGIDCRRQLARWIIMQDHWYQHNTEYLSGSIEVSPHPEIRVGYRLDIIEKNMSFYVEGVSHNWEPVHGMSTVLTVTRGQPNNPFPVYVHPATDGFGATTNQRKIGSRLDEYFITPDPVAIRNFYAIRANNTIKPGGFSFNSGPLAPATNATDTFEHMANRESYTDSENDYVLNTGVTEEERQIFYTSINTGPNGGLPSMDTAIASVPTPGVVT